MKFFKYHALGNDYLVIDPEDWPSPLTPLQIKVICHRNFGVGSDGILLGPLPSDQARFALRIFNPDVLVHDLKRLGFTSTEETTWRRMLAQPHGIVLVTGPTAFAAVTFHYDKVFGDLVAVEQTL